MKYHIAALSTRDKEAIVMGLLDDSPYGLLTLRRNPLQERFNTDHAPVPGPWLTPDQQQRPPLSLAGPGFIEDVQHPDQASRLPARRSIARCDLQDKT